MCLISKKRYPTKARKDISVYKVLCIDSDFCGTGHTRIVSPMYGLKCYEPGKTYSENLFGIDVVNSKRIGFPDKWEVNAGFYSFRNINKAREYAGNCEYARSLMGYTSKHYSVFYCIIPKGSMYYTGIEGELCSNTLTVIEIVE